MQSNSRASNEGYANGALGLPGGSAGMLDLVENHDFAAPATSFSFTGLDGDTDEVYLLVYKLIKAVAAAMVVELQPNGVTTGQLTHAHYDGSSAGNVSPSTLQIMFNAAANIGEFVTGTLWFHAKSGTYRTGRANWTDSRGATLFFMDAGMSWSDTAANITSLDVVADQANGIAIGSYLRLYRVLKA